MPKRFATEFTDIRTNFCVAPQVNSQRIFSSEFGTAYRTLVGLVVGIMHYRMVFQMMFRLKTGEECNFFSKIRIFLSFNNITVPFRALITLKGAISRVSAS